MSSSGNVLTISLASDVWRDSSRRHLLSSGLKSEARVAMAVVNRFSKCLHCRRSPLNLVSSTLMGATLHFGLSGAVGGGVVSGRSAPSRTK